VLNRPLLATSATLVVSAALVLVAATAAAEEVPVLGAKQQPLIVTRGFGNAHPRLILAGVPKGTGEKAWRLRWTGWGAATAHARGLTYRYGGYHYGRVAIELRASRIGRCRRGGRRAYTFLEVRTAVRPGGRFDRWHAWLGWKNICGWH